MKYIVRVGNGISVLYANAEYHLPLRIFNLCSKIHYNSTANRKNDVAWSATNIAEYRYLLTCYSFIIHSISYFYHSSVHKIFRWYIQLWSVCLGFHNLVTPFIFGLRGNILNKVIQKFLAKWFSSLEIVYFVRRVIHYYCAQILLKKFLLCRKLGVCNNLYVIKRKIVTD